MISQTLDPAFDVRQAPCERSGASSSTAAQLGPEFVEGNKSLSSHVLEVGTLALEGPPAGQAKPQPRPPDCRGCRLVRALIISLSPSLRASGFKSRVGDERPYGVLRFFRSDVLRHRASPFALQVPSPATIIMVDLGPGAIRRAVAEHSAAASGAFHKAG